MSWDAALIDKDAAGNEREVGDWNYTHNCNAMVAKVLDTYGNACGDHFLVGRTWFDALDGITSAESVPFLAVIVGGLQEAPAMFREMNPPNGWGDYDSLLAVLTAMHAKAARHPDARWSASG